MSAEDDNNLKLKRVERLPGLGIFELDISWRDRVKGMCLMSQSPQCLLLFKEYKHSSICHGCKTLPRA